MTNTILYRKEHTGIVLYTKDGCPKCEEVKQLCSELNLAYQHYKLGEDFTHTLLQHNIPGVETYPVIVIDGEWVINYNSACIKIKQVRKDLDKARESHKEWRAKQKRNEKINHILGIIFCIGLVFIIGWSTGW